MSRVWHLCFEIIKGNIDRNILPSAYKIESQFFAPNVSKGERKLPVTSRPELIRWTNWLPTDITLDSHNPGDSEKVYGR